MKRKLLFSALALGSVGTLWTCWSAAQDQSISGTVKSTVTTNSGQSSVITKGPATATNLYGNAAQNYAMYYSLAAKSEDRGLNQEVRSLMKSYASADDAAKDKIVADLKVAVGKLFDIRQDARLQELTRLEEQLKRLKDVHAKRANQKDQIVMDRVQQMIREADGLGWGTGDNWQAGAADLFGQQSAFTSPADSVPGEVAASVAVGVTGAGGLTGATTPVPPVAIPPSGSAPARR
jgi:hypothetical protein